MTPAVHDDRLRRLRQRGEAFFQDLKNTPPEHQQLLRHAWDESLKATDGAHGDPGEAASAARKTSRLDAILSLLERITRTSHAFNAQGNWFSLALSFLVDAVAHAGEDVPLPPPLLAVEPIDSPLYVPRAHVPGEWLAQATPAQLPLPVVLCPGNLLEEPWAWAMLFHELGHHLDTARGDSISVLPLLEVEDERVNLGAWLNESWLGEVIADLYAGLLGGAGAVETLKASFTTRPNSGSHPADADRKMILEAAWTGILDGSTPSGERPNDIVARALVERFKPWHARVAGDCVSAEASSARLVPGFLFRQHLAGTPPDALRESCQHAFASGKRFQPPWVLTEGHLKTLAEAMRNLVETRVRPGAEALKVPPLELLIRHDRISFVGATHGQLVAELREAKKHRNKPHALIEVFALADVPLRELTLGGRSGEVLLADRDESLRELREYLNHEQIPHRLYLYDQPYFFASFWDVEGVEARPEDAPPAHIHVSSAQWGMDLRHAVGQDLESPPGEPLPMAMRRRVEALMHLRKVSRELPSH
ncbi:hypothetical protein [Corallococcus exercitus]|uniref:Uncharacterized protein n=1 Tax=Corallococcus exercitus TaxID=2316736 RepID=A0A7Y4JPW2_9BACT|nr:hypothetical protein [Corallococcus exercitus]NOK08968.1 hypothetical protein [Corallococcus exercitus]